MLCFFLRAKREVEFSCFCFKHVKLCFFVGNERKAPLHITFATTLFGEKKTRSALSLNQSGPQRPGWFGYSPENQWLEPENHPEIEKENQLPNLCFLVANGRFLVFHWHFGALPIALRDDWPVTSLLRKRPWMPTRQRWRLYQPRHQRHPMIHVWCLVARHGTKTAWISKVENGVVWRSELWQLCSTKLTNQVFESVLVLMNTGYHIYTSLSGEC